MCMQPAPRTPGASNISKAHNQDKLPLQRARKPTFKISCRHVSLWLNTFRNVDLPARKQQPTVMVVSDGCQPAAGGFGGHAKDRAA